MIRKVSFPVLMNAQRVDLKKGIKKLELTEWKTSVIRLLEERIKTLSHKYIKIKSSTTTIKNDKVKRSFDGLHDNFVTVPIDKTNDSIKKLKSFYTQVIIKKLGIDNKFNTNSNYEYFPSINKVTCLSLILTSF